MVSKSKAEERYGELLLYMTKTPPTTFHGWSRLPDELKVEVLSHNLTFQWEICSAIHIEQLKDHLGPLIATQNRQLASISQELYYKSNTFRVIIRLYDPPMYSISYPKPFSAAMIRHLRVLALDCTLKDTFEDMVLKPLGWSWLLRSRRPIDQAKLDAVKSTQAGFSSSSDANKDTAWQNTFTNLQSLEINIHCDDLKAVQFNTQSCCVKAARLVQMRDWLAETEILFKAPTLEFYMIMIVDLKYQVDRIRVCCKHNDILKGLEDMVTRGT